MIFPYVSSWKLDGPTGSSSGGRRSRSFLRASLSVAWNWRRNPEGIRVRKMLRKKNRLVFVNFFYCRFFRMILGTWIPSHFLKEIQWCIFETPGWCSRMLKIHSWHLVTLQPISRRHSVAQLLKPFLRRQSQICRWNWVGVNLGNTRFLAKNGENMRALWWTALW